MSETGELLRATAARTLAASLDIERRSAADEGEWLEEVWSELSHLGVTALLVPEAGGGVGAGLAEAYGLVAELGRAALPLPAGETILAAKLLSDAGIEVPEGPIALAPARPGEVLAVIGKGAAMRARGRLAGVPWARRASAVVASTRRGGRHCVCVLALAGEGARIVPGVNIAGEPRDGIELDDAPVIAAAETTDEALVWRTGAALRAAQIAGGLSRVLEITVEYARTRQQFGRAIGQFQAVQQQLAVLAAETAAASAAARAAFVALDAADAPFLVATAKVAAGEAASKGAATAHQARGAMGFTAEYPLHYHTRRLWSWREEFGNESWWAGHLGTLAAAAGADALWSAITRCA